MSWNSFLIRIHRRLWSFLLLCVFIHNLLIKWWFWSLLFLIRYLLFFALIWSSHQKTLNLMIVLFVSKDLPHYFILVTIWYLILAMLPSTADSWVRTLHRFSAIHICSTVWSARRLSLNRRLIIFSVTSRHLIYDAEPFLCELRVVLGWRCPCSSWCLGLLLPLSIIIGGTGRQSGFFEIPCQQNRLIFPCLVT